MRPILVVDCYVEGDGTSNFRRLLNEYTLETWRALVEPKTYRWPWSAFWFFLLALTRPDGIMYAAIGGF